MSDDAFADIKEAVEDALAFGRGERRNLHVTRIQGFSLQPVLAARH